MPVYTFEDAKTGQAVFISSPMAKAVSIGRVVRRQGRRLRRVVDQPQANVKYDGLFRNYQISRKHPLAKEADGYDDRGVPLFNGRSRARDFAKKGRDQGLAMDFDG